MELFLGFIIILASICIINGISVLNLLIECIEEMIDSKIRGHELEFHNKEENGD